MSNYLNPIARLLLSVVAVALCSAAITAQTSSGKCRPDVIPVENEPPPKIFAEAALADPLARGVAVIQYCTENLHIVPVFGVKALAATPRVGHLHVRVDDSSWVWAEASGNPIILLGLAPGPHKVTLDLMNANHQPLDKAYQLNGKPPVTLKAGESLYIPAGTIHAAKNVGKGNGSELATYIVEKGKPLVAMAK